MKQTFKVALTVSFFFSLSLLNTTIMGQRTSDGGDTARFLLNRVMDNRNKVENFKCTVEYHQYRSKEFMQKIINRFQERLSKKRVQELTDSLHEYTIQKHKLALDNKGLARVQIVFYISDVNGKLIKEDRKRIITWDGENSIKYSEQFGGRSAVLSNQQTMEVTKQHRQPWQTFGGTFYDRFAKAIADGNVTNVEIKEDGTYQVEYLLKENVKSIAVIDPSQGYSVMLQENYENGQINYRAKAIFREVSPNTWYPIEGEIITFSGDNLAQVITKDTVKISEIIINDPNFYDGLFHVDFPEGTHIRDVISGLQYVVGEPMSQRLDGATNIKSLQEVAIDTLDEIANGVDKQYKEVEIFIPKVDLALEDVISYVLCLSDGKLVNPLNKPESEESNKFLTELGKGDIAWDGVVVATRRAKVFTIKQESGRPLKLTEGKWTNSYKLPEKVELPYSTLVIDDEGVNYLMKITKIDSNGITIIYRKLNTDEFTLYRE